MQGLSPDSNIKSFSISQGSSTLRILAVVSSVACFLDPTPAERRAEIMWSVTWMALHTAAMSPISWAGTPKTYNGKVLVSRWRSVVAYDAADGHELWRHAITRKYSVFGPASFVAVNGLFL